MSQAPAQTSLAEIKRASVALPSDIQSSFFTAGGFELMQRGARLLASSTLVPSAYQATLIKRNKYGDIESQTENPNAIPNCVLALNMSQRMGADPLMVMQNLYLVEGRPAWSSQFIIAAINACGKFSPLRFDIEDKGEREMEWIEKIWKKNQQGKSYREEIQKKAIIHDFQCTAWAMEKATDTRLSSPKVSLEMAVQEGWYGKDGSKWKTMPEVMLRYRAASFFGKLYAPELLMGIQTAEEVHDTIDLSSELGGAFGLEGDKRNTMTTSDITGHAIAPVTLSSAEKTVAPNTGEASEGVKPAETSTPTNGEDRQTGNKERAAQIAALSRLREEVKTAWLATGAQIEDAEKLVNAFATKWNTAQCQRIQNEIESRQESAVPLAPEQPDVQGQSKEVLCPRTSNSIDDWACAGCRERDGCPAWAEE